jgi:hypothetical protein
MTSLLVEFVSFEAYLSLGMDGHSVFFKGHTSLAISGKFPYISSHIPDIAFLSLPVRLPIKMFRQFSRQKCN